MMRVKVTSAIQRFNAAQYLSPQPEDSADRRYFDSHVYFSSRQIIHLPSLAVHERQKYGRGESGEGA